MSNRNLSKSNRKALRIMIAEGQDLVREALHQLILTWSDMEVVAHAEDCAEVWDKAQIYKPSVIVLDTNLKHLDVANTPPSIHIVGQIIRRLRLDLPFVRILLISSYYDDIERQQLTDAGVSGFFLKQSDFKEFGQAIRYVGHGGFYFDPNIPSWTTSSPSAFKESLLSQREMEILKLTVQGYSGREIANRIGCSAKTIEGYKSKISRKMDFNSRVDWVRYAIRRGWLAEE